MPDDHDECLRLERMTPSARRVVRRAWEESHGFGVGTGHLLLALVLGDDYTARALRGVGITEEHVRNMVTVGHLSYRRAPDAALPDPEAPLWREDAR